MPTPGRYSISRWTAPVAPLLAFGLLSLVLIWPAHRTHGQRIVTSPLVMFAVADTEITQPPSRIDPPPIAPEARGAVPRLSAGWNHLAGNYRALLRFEPPPLDEDARLVRAELELLLWSASVSSYSLPSPETGTMRLSISGMGSAWTEDVTFQEMPTLPRLGEPEWSYELPWGPCGQRTCGRMRLDVTELARRWLADPTENHGLVLDASAITATAHFGAQIDFGSRESSMPARLIIELEGPGGGGAEPSPTPDLVTRLYLPWLTRSE